MLPSINTPFSSTIFSLTMGSCQTTIVEACTWEEKQTCMILPTSFVANTLENEIHFCSDVPSKIASSTEKGPQ